MPDPAKEYIDRHAAANDPVTVVAHSIGDSDDPEDRQTAREALRDLTRSGWHLVRFGPGTDGVGTHLPTVEIAQEWTP